MCGQETHGEFNDKHDYTAGCRDHDRQMDVLSFMSLHNPRHAAGGHDSEEASGLLFAVAVNGIIPALTD